MRDDLTLLEKNLVYSFNDKGLLREALIHSSYAYEHGLTLSNERFEFMGDAVLHLLLTEYLMKAYPGEDEGQLSALRSYCESGPFLSLLASRLEIGPFIKFGRGEGQSGGEFKESLLADTMEAIIAAIHFDGGYESAKNFILGHIKADIGRVHDEGLHIDQKSELQILTQKYFKNMPEYTVISETGPEHEKNFAVSVVVNANETKFQATGAGKNKKSAEKKAAGTMLAKLKAAGWN